MRESTIMKIHYATALGSVALVVIHILFRFTQNFHDSLKFENVLINYSLLPYSILLELILILISIHGFNGLRIILLELNQGKNYETLVTYSCLASMIALITYGSRTILMASMGMI
ncbi:MAG: succinate dehydrogenase [Nitrosopumilaceae archaeon]|nr:succinate dehydrogenase [Nitrosopumilaceae archaeon]